MAQEPQETNAIPAGSVDAKALREKVIQQLGTIHDPEISVNIYDLGLIYGVDVDSSGAVVIHMTLTAPNCPEAESLPAFVEARIRRVPGVAKVRIDLVWEPPWSLERLSEAARLQLGL